MAALHLAFKDHRPIALSPDMIWLLVVQGVANHINCHSKTLRKKFVRHSGKRELTVEKHEFIKGSPDNAWPDAFSDFSWQIREHVDPSVHDFFTARFSTTGLCERAAFEISLMDAVQSYFELSLKTICGIPQITLEGNSDDWHAMLDRFDVLRSLDMKWWEPTLRGILEQFVRASEGQADPTFWQSIYKAEMMSGGYKVDGWITAFFPYLKNPKTGRASIPAIWRKLGPDVFSRSSEDSRYLGIYLDGIPSGLASAPVTWEYLSEVFKIEFIGGFVGVNQEPETLRLRPEIGWVIRERKQDE
jgi:hypothetical protein